MSLTFQGQACWALSNLCLEGRTSVSPSRIPQGLEWSWQAAWDLWKGLDGAQSLCLGLWARLVRTWAGTSGLPWGALQLLVGGAPWKRCVACEAGLGADYYGELGHLGS